MASLDKLAIRGIRSFDDKQISVIEFFTPVTVIVGHNGSGKTTIIECLKYATTGDQPPNTRGGAFVHDPKMANEKEVKAQVKLRFHAANGNRMLAVRNLSVTMKKNGALTMKTLESILGLADEQRGKRGAISTKCAEMDAEIPQLLGVSKAVLENVIFCHQEDSYWPLAEPSVLKKKFDDIFEATKYTKALDNIKSLRKDRVAELKAEKERLESLSKEKAHADKLKARINDLRNTIVTKETEYEQLGKQIEFLIAANARFYDTSTKFRETYMKAENLNERKLRYQEEFETARENVQEIQGTDQELAERLQNFDEHIIRQRQKRQSQSSKLQDVEEELERQRQLRLDVSKQQGQLMAEEKAQEQLVADREKLIHELAAKHQIRGYDHTPLDRKDITEFMNKLDDLQRTRVDEVDQLQNEDNAKTEEYTAKSSKLHTELEGYKQQKLSLRDRITKAQTRVAEAEAEFDKATTLTSQSQILQADIEEKELRVEKTKADIKSANFEQRLADANTKARSMELRRDDLTAEIRTLSLLADTRARLDIKKADLKSKTNEVENTVKLHDAKFRIHVGFAPKADTMEKEIERVISDKERTHAEAEAESSDANKKLQAAETNLSYMKAQLKTARDEAQTLGKEIESKLKQYQYESVKEAINECKAALSDLEYDSQSIQSSQELYKHLVRAAKAKKCCPLCTRNLNEAEHEVLEQTVQQFLKKLDAFSEEKNRQEREQWQNMLKDLEPISAKADKRESLQGTTILSLEKSVSSQETEITPLASAAEKASDKLAQLKQELKELSVIRQHASGLSQLLRDIERLKRDITGMEEDLSTTGSIKTVDDLQAELDALSSELRANEREKQNIQTERDRLMNALRNHETDLSAMRVRHSELKSEIREKTMLQGRIEEEKADITYFTTQLKELDAKIADAQGPIEQLEREYQEVHRDLRAKIAQASRISQEMNMSVDKLNAMNDNVKRYSSNRRGQLLRECNQQIEDCELQIQSLTRELEGLRIGIEALDKEINESNSSLINLRENLRLRKLKQDIAATEAEIDALDLEEAARAKRIFDEKYNAEKQKETRLQSTHAHLGGEISTLKAQAETLEADRKDFKDIHQKYRDQLIKVKMSDMANNDLEKYAKALDNAIMKYHSLKMEEVNDTMRHLWNKTYQGTDIDGIKISSDSEGGVTKRSYNYRVVMTKDQVEMDMRGRCSAGQKMLASIIIRLALADSFGQNCGILALDEPTNALDTENIDALAASLVDIINERKSNSNFQLIIITHDENFLRKLGQSNVMEYYWRVTRDPRQKSIIERHRFG
ncbi:hypothetical protein WOLCODRAFT_162047 [Wolfiporia cocos MD-104 SS10]|uniref:DNA repair protein RAD50 n=1 Tax=Wolfiporia cocos (strain MD-104) TaxID=742152 RepID=A0A2H3JV64_WOLCO|nr:hypothetical protein WOLCODRAFT_162047 [Wolfiporia cocos MD-104 SS10]